MENPTPATLRVGRFAAIAVFGALVVHALPLALGVVVPMPMLSVALIASFFVGHPAMSVPLFVELRASRVREAPPRALVVAALATGIACGMLVVVSHVVVDVRFRGVPFDSIELVPMLVHPVVSTFFAAIACGLALLRRRGAP